MRILFFSSIYPHPLSRTCGTFNRELCRALVAEHDVRVVAPRSWLAPNRHSAVNRTRSLPETPDGLSVSSPRYFYPPKVLRHHYGSFMWYSVRKHLEQIVDEFQPDCIVSYWAHPDGEVGLRAARSHGLPAVVIVGGSDVLVLPQWPKRRRCVCRVLQQSNAVVTVSEGLRRSVIDLNTPQEQVHTVYQGVDRTVFRNGNRAESRHEIGILANQTAVLWVGRMVSIKGLDILLEAVQYLVQDARNFHFYLAGDGPDRSALMHQANASGIADRIHCVGAVPHERLSQWYQAADVTVLSSWSEGLPNVLRESLACGTPFVTTDVGSVSEIADPGFSLLVPAGEPRLLAGALQTVANPQYQRNASAYQARSWEDTASDLVDVIHSVLPRSYASSVAIPRKPKLLKTPSC